MAGESKPMPLGCAVAFLAVAVLVVGLFVYGAVTGGDDTQSAGIGDTVFITTGSGSEVGAGITRAAFGEAVKAAAAKDHVGFNQLVASGDIVLIDDCSRGLLIDTALLGERQVRLDDGRAVWVDSSWLKDTC